MGKERKIKRCRLVNYLNVIDESTDAAIGILVDFSTEGLMLESESAIPVEKIFNLAVEVASQMFSLEAQSLWCRKDEKNKVFHTGFTIETLPFDTMNAIWSLEEAACIDKSLD